MIPNKDILKQRIGNYTKVNFDYGKHLNKFVDEYMAGGIEENGTTKKSELFFKTLYTATFYYVYNDPKYGEKVKRTILNQINNLDWKTWPYYDHNNDAQGIFHMGNAVARLWHSYNYCKDLFSDVEIWNIKTWFIDAANYFLNNTHEVLKATFPGRLNDDYKCDRIGYTDGEFTHKNKDGKYNQIHWAHLQYNNRLMSQITIIGLVGIEYDLFNLKEYAIRTCKEYIKFAVFPDGTTSEYQRNYLSDRANTGTLYYNYFCISPIIWVAEILRQKGDTSLYEYTTSEGYETTKGGIKNLKLVIDTTCKVINGEVEWYSAKNSGGTSDLIEVDSPDASGVRKHTVGDSLFAMANMYYKDQYIEDTILRKNAKPYPDRGYIGIAGWYYGHGGVYSPGYLITFEGLTVELFVEDTLISEHNELKEAYQSAFGKEITRKGKYEVWQRPDGTKYIIQPNIEIR